MSSPSPTQLRYLVAALDQTSWKEAARSVGVTPSAFSQGLAELERRLGVALFAREGRGRVPTPEADAVGVRARRILAEYAALDRWAEASRQGDTGDLRVGMIDTAAVWHFGDALAVNSKHLFRITMFGVLSNYRHRNRLTRLTSCSNG